VNLLFNQDHRAIASHCALLRQRQRHLARSGQSLRADFRALGATPGGLAAAFLTGAVAARLSPCGQPVTKPGMGDTLSLLLSPGMLSLFQLLLAAGVPVRAGTEPGDGREAMTADE
jgi:hypothetical protein